MRDRHGRDFDRGRDFDARDRGEFSGGPYYPERFEGYYARDEHRGGMSGDYARDGGWSGAGRAEEHVREPEHRGYRGRGPKNWRRPDERIRETVIAMLTDADEVDATDIDVTVENGEITLAGVVGSRMEKRAAEDVAMACRDVQDVHNRLVVTDREQRIGKASE